MGEIRDVYVLKAEHCRLHPSSHFFDADTLRFFGERLSTMNILKKHSMITDGNGEEHECYCLSSRQHYPWGGTGRKYFYFDIKTLEEIVC